MVFASCHNDRAYEPVNKVSLVELVSHEVISGPAEYGILCVRHGSITSALSNEDKIGRGDLWAIH